VSYEVPEQTRRRLLKYGALITGPAAAANAIAVSAAATTILVWLEESGGEAEFERRCAALERQYHNACIARWEGEAGEFVESARILRDWSAADADIEVFTSSS
jgi:hypothetical protein